MGVTWGGGGLVWSAILECVWKTEKTSLDFLIRLLPQNEVRPRNSTTVSLWQQTITLELCITKNFFSYFPRVESHWSASNMLLHEYHYVEIVTNLPSVSRVYKAWLVYCSDKQQIACVCPWHEWLHLDA